MIPDAYILERRARAFQSLARVAIAEVVGSGSEITVKGAGLCSIYLRALVARWSERATGAA